MVLSQISNKLHKFQQITKQGKGMYNVRQTGINADFKYPMTCLNSLIESVSFTWDGILYHNFEPMYDKLSNP